ncbi:MAG: type VI secretion system-associated FHA domain protein TagH [Sphingomonas sp.]
MWTLLLSRASDPPGSFFDRRQIDTGQIKVGRSNKTCDLVLPDDHGFISRHHCTISAVGLDLFVVDTSVNGVALNDQGGRIAPNMPVAIRPGDRLLVGDFIITVATDTVGAGISLVPPPPPPLAATPSSLGGDSWFDTPIDPIWDNGQTSSSVHEFLGNAMDDFLTPSGGMPSRPSAPSDFGFGDPLGQAFSRPIMADPLPPPTNFGIPEDWASTPLSGPAPASTPAQSFAPPPAPAASFSQDPFADTPFPEAPFKSDAADPFDLSTPLSTAPEAWEPFPEPPAAPPPAVPAPAATPRVAPVGTPGQGVDWSAFYEGAGLSPEELQLSPDAMFRLGVLYRQIVLGLWDLIQDRAAFKDEFRVERTQLSIGKNNPLKHLPPLDAAKFLLGEPLPGFMSTEDTVRTAFEDIKKHQLAMLAGVQHALAAVFDRLSPAEIDKLIEKAAGQKKGMSFFRGIDRWSVYQTVFEALKRDAVSNANGVMSVAFREGYEKFLKSGQ